MMHFGRFVHTYSTGDRIMMCSLLFLFVATFAIGYLWFLIMYPNPGKGDTVKATHMIHISPFVAILGAELLHRTRQKSARAYLAIVTLLAVSLLHNLPVFITRHISCL